MYSHTKSTGYRRQLAREVLHSVHPQFVTCSVKQWPVTEHIRMTNEAYPLLGTTTVGTGGTVPPTFRLGTNNVLVPQLLGHSFQKAINFTAGIVTSAH